MIPIDNLVSGDPLPSPAVDGDADEKDSDNDQDYHNANVYSTEANDKLLQTATDAPDNDKTPVKSRCTRCQRHPSKDWSIVSDR